jgi:hypothetical protein
MTSKAAGTPVPTHDLGFSRLKGTRDKKKSRRQMTRLLERESEFYFIRPINVSKNGT